jgi:type I restriction enzyme S subunit
VNGDIDYNSVNYISEEDYNNINKRSFVEDGDIIMAMIGTIGKPIIVKRKNVKFCIKNVALIKFGKSIDVINTYIQFLLDNTSYKQYINKQNKGGTQKFIALGAIRKLDIPLPTLTLQQLFAQNIEAIEKQKALIKQSIADTEELFNSRMDYYFN